MEVVRAAGSLSAAMVSVTGKIASVMRGPWAILSGAYVAGVIWGLLVINERPARRIGLVLLWPLGPIAFVVTVAILLVASLIAYPVFGALVLAAGVVALTYSTCASA
jgi:hypothetical protein